jgi:peptidyl-prolyl cis-trans isomerase D
VIDGMRKFAKSKWAAGLLLIPLAISLAVFLPDVSGGNASLAGGTLSRIGGREVKITDVERDTQRLLDEIRQQEGRVITSADAVREGRVQGILQDLEIRNTLLAYADKTGVQASDASLKPYLERNKLLVDEFGKLSRDAILYQASQRRQSTREFEQFIRDFLTQDYIREAAGAAMVVPDILSQPWINYLGESRTFSLAQVTASTAAVTAEPTDADLQAWYEAHKGTFQQPERRRISVLTYTPDDFIDQVKLTDAEVQAKYQERIKEYSTPETRTVVEFQSADRNVVQAFIDLSVQGISVEEALTRTPGLTRKELTVKPADIADEQYRDFLFAMQAGKVHNVPVRMKEDEPWRAVMVQTITPGVPTPYAEIADKVRRDVSWNDAVGLFEASADPFRDAAGGQPLEDIGKQFGIPVISLAPIDAQAGTMYGDQAQIMVKEADAMRQLFTLSAGDMTNVFEGDNVRSMYRLDEIIPPYTLAFADVKDRVKVSYMTEKLVEARDKAANDMVAAVLAGTAFDKAAATSKMTVLPPLTVLRAGNPPIDPAVVSAAFALKDGEVAVVRGRDNNPWVALVDKVEKAKPEITAMLKAQLGDQVSQSLLQDLNEVFVRGLRSEVDYKRDDAAVQKYLEGLVGESAPK